MPARLLPLAVVALLTASTFGAENIDKQLRTWQPAKGPDVEAKLVSQTDKEVVLADAAGKKTTLAVADLGTEDLRYLRNVREAVSEFRTWRLNGAARAEEVKRQRLDTRPGLALYLPETVRGSFVKATCYDTKLTEEFVVLILDDFTRRAWPLKLFSDEDRQYVQQMKTRVDASVKRSREPYKMQWLDYDPVKDKADVNVIETDHFSIWYGNDKTASGWKLITEKDPPLLERNAKLFEQVWNFYQDEMKVRMPFSVPPPLKESAGDPNKYKLPVYITGTGLPKHKEGWAFGSRAIIMHPGALAEGTSVFSHEFTHVMQLFMGGYRTSDYVGWFWECHANWSGHQFIPGYPPVLDVYTERAHYELDSSRHNYGSWPFLQYLAEHPRFQPSFCYDIWLANRKNDKDESIEDPFMTLMRLGVERGLLKGDGCRDFGDLIGEMAAHNAEYDYVYQYPYERALAYVRYGCERPFRGRTVLCGVPDRPGWYRPIWSHTPRKYGYNIVDLTPEAGAAEVQADLQGIPDEIDGSDWRVTLVAIDDRGQSRYSRMVHGGPVSLKLRPNEKRVALAVAAAPTFYHADGFRIGFNNKRRFPYEVAFKGCRPAAAPPVPADNDLLRRGDGAPHPDGGGFVARSAKVDATAYVGPDAAVLGNAKVLGSARIEDHAVVFQDATVADGAILTDYARAGGRAKVTGQARVRDCAMVGGQVEVTDRARVRDYVVVTGLGNGPSKVAGDAIIRGWGEINVQPDVTFGGGTVAGEDCEVHLFNEKKQPIAYEYGLFYGYWIPGFASKENWDNHYLYAQWDFDEPRAHIARDVNADCDAILRGSPKFGRDGGRRCLDLNGKDQYGVVEGHVADSAALTIDMQLLWNGAASDERVFEFGSAVGTLGFTPRDAKGRAAVILAKGSTVETVVADQALPKGKWTRVTIVLDGEEGRLYVDGKPAGAAKLTLRPEDIRATAGYLGRAYKGGGFFGGRLDDIAVYRTGYKSPADIPNMWWYKGRKGAWTADRETGVIAQSDAKGQTVAYQGRNYRDATFTLKARKTGGDGGIGVAVRAMDGFDHPRRYVWLLGARGNKKTYLADGEGAVIGEEVDGSVEPNRWYDLKVVVSGTTIDCFLDGKPVLKRTDDRLWYGGVGLVTSDAQAEFKDLEVQPSLATVPLPRS